MLLISALLAVYFYLPFPLLLPYERVIHAGEGTSVNQITQQGWRGGFGCVVRSMVRL